MHDVHSWRMCRTPQRDVDETGCARDDDLSGSILHEKARLKTGPYECLASRFGNIKDFPDVFQVLSCRLCAILTWPQPQEDLYVERHPSVSRGISRDDFPSRVRCSFARATKQIVGR